MEESRFVLGRCGGVQICSGPVWRSPDLLWAGMEESRFVLGQYGGVQICSGSVWRSLDLFWASMEESRFVLGRYGGVQICSGPVWRSPDFNLEFVLETDVSDYGVGAVLTQVDENGEEHPNAYFSRKLLPRK